MQDYKREFIKFALSKQVLQFGEFTLKSGRISPYFFNAGRFNDGLSLAKLGRFYAAAIKESEILFDILYGPAYKGIPLAVATAIALHEQYEHNMPYCFNRKEVKDHGEGGLLVGAPLMGRALIVDDVITAGTAIRESMQVLKNAQAQLAGIVIALDRQEISPQGSCSAIQEVEKQYQSPVISIVKFNDIVAYIESDSVGDNKRYLQGMLEYRKKYGV